MGEQQDRLKEAICELSDYLNEELATGKHHPERVYQEFLEEFPEVFDVMGFSKAIPTPSLPLSKDADLEGESIEPDFLAYDDRSGRWVIIELKTPSESLVTKPKRRQKFRASIESFISQVNEYAEYFDEGAHRRLTQEKLGISVDKNPDIYVLVGYGDDPEQVHKIASRQKRNIEVWQFDRLLDGLIERYERLYDHRETIPGISTHMIVGINEGNPDGRAFLFDIGRSLSRNRFSLFVVDGKSLGVEVLDSSGRSYSVELPFAEHFEIGEKVYVHFEFVTSDAFSSVSISVNNRVTRRIFVQERIATKQILNQSPSYYGADITGGKGAAFKLYEVATYSQSQTFRDRMKLYWYFWDKDLAKDTPKNSTHVEFSRDSYSYQDLPNTNLIQPNEDLAPVYRDPKNWNLTKKLIGYSEE